MLLVGLPGSGKSTLARRLAPQIGAVILESDAVRRLLSARSHHDAAENARVFGAIYASASRLLRSGVSVILDATNLKASDRRPALSLAREAGARFFIVQVEAHVGLIEQRLRARERDGGAHDGSDAGIEVFRRMSASAELPEREASWIVNTGDAAAYASTIDRIVVAVTTLAPDALGPKGGFMGGRP